ncbi:aminotransferase class V-fold PLP-dependent enzyme [Rhizobium beringeri]
MPGALPQLSNGWLYLDNAGGSYVPEAVIQATLSSFRESKNQPYPHFKSGKLADMRIEEAHQDMAALINAKPSEIIMGPSTSANLYVLAQAFRPLLSPGDEIIVTDQDHESNIGPWMRLADFGVKIVVWGIDPQTGSLDIEQLKRLVSARTKIVAFTHVSNVVADINPVAEIVAIAHEAGAKVVVDGVAFAGHALVDVEAWDVDFYTFSLYKTFGPHQAVLYGKTAAIEACSGQSHYFYDHDVP